MKIYYQNFGWEGSVTIIASSQEEARKIAKERNIRCYEPDMEFDEYEITIGVCLECLGDS